VKPVIVVPVLLTNFTPQKKLPTVPEPIDPKARSLEPLEPKLYRFPVVVDPVVIPAGLNPAATLLAAYQPGIVVLSVQVNEVPEDGSELKVC